MDSFRKKKSQKVRFVSFRKDSRTNPATLVSTVEGKLRKGKIR